jgi:hypothetical protein
VALALTLVAALPGRALADRLTVAIVPGTAVNLDASRVDTLSQELADALRDELDIDTIGGLEVRRRLPAEGLPADCIAIPACITDVANRVGAQQLLFVVMVDDGTGGAIQVDITWVDPSSGKAASRPAIDIATVTTAKSQFASAAQMLLPEAPVRAKPEVGLGRMSAPIPRHFELPSYLTAAATVVGLGVGVSFGLRARSKYRDCEALARLDMACSADRKDSIRTTAVLADVGWLVALGSTIATAVLYASSAEASHVIVEPVSGGAAISAIGRF